MAASTASAGTLLLRIQEYRQKYYQNRLLKGVIFSAALLLSVFLAFNAIEYFGRFSSGIRGTLFFGFLAVLLFSLYQWVVQPLINLYGIRQPLSNEAAASQIGQYFPDIGDKLLNTLQLQSLSGQQTDLIEASIRQKSNQLLVVRFADAIRFQENKQYLKYAVYPLAAIAVILLFKPGFFTSSSDRIIHFQKNYTYAPFTFKIENKALKAFRNEDFVLNLTLEGEALPKAVYMMQNGTRFKLEQQGDRAFAYTFKNVQRDVTFSFDAAGFASDNYSLKVIERPSLLAFDVNLRYPAYLNKPAESLANVGNLTVPEGTTVEWNFNTSATKSLGLKFDNDSLLYKAQNRDAKRYQYSKSVRRSTQYQVMLQNDETPNSEKIGYYINVIPDKHPVLNLENFQDTTLFNYLVLGGSISDDYGFSQLKLFYSVRRDQQPEDKKPEMKSIAIPFNKTTNTQSFYFQWYVDSLKLAPGDKIEYFAQVWDNDGVNGPKSARSRTINFAIPSKQKLQEEVDKSAKQTEKEMQDALKKAQSLERDLENLDKKLKTNKELDFQERKQVEDILKKRESLMEEIRSIQEQNKATNEKTNQFKQQNEETQKKLDQLQKLMDDLMNDETSKLYKELEKLLEKKDSERMSKMLEKLRNKENNLEKELERTLNLFKKMQMEQKMEETIKDLQELADKEDQLADKSQQNEKNKNDEDKKAKNEDLKKEQEKIQEEFKDTKEDLDEIEKMGEEIEEQPETQQEQEKSADQQMEQSKKELDQQKNSDASESQKKAAKSMREMSSAMSASMESAEMQQMEEDIDALRDILENLITLSFDQEKLMKDFKGVNLQDPRFVTLGQEQLKLQDDARVVEDSLYALANRVVQIQSFITRELNDMKSYMDESVTNIKDRRINVATSKQQFAMTSMNNLALMLSDVFRQMQQQMAMAMAMPGSGKGKDKGKGKSPGAGEMQQKLNEQIQKMGQGQHSGEGKQGGQGQQGVSEQLARMAAEQSMIRKMIQELLEESKGTKAGQQFGDQLKDLIEKMDQNETDLVNKRVNPELKKRNQDIVTRLLESEKAMREQGEDDKRKGETATEIVRRPPPAFEQYIKAKEKQTELLRSTPPNFSPFYKKEVDAYFRKYQSDE